MSKFLRPILEISCSRWPVYVRLRHAPGLVMIVAAVTDSAPATEFEADRDAPDSAIAIGIVLLQPGRSRDFPHPARHCC